LTVRTPLPPNEISARLRSALGAEGRFLDPKGDPSQKFVGRADERSFRFHRRRTFGSRNRPTLQGSIREDSTGGSVIRTHYPVDLWLRLLLVGLAAAYLISYRTRALAPEQLYFALAVALLALSMQRYKSGDREFLLDTLARPAPPQVPR
jgi:hypothetical protein